jgi:hypothetical protein
MQWTFEYLEIEEAEPCQELLASSSFRLGNVVLVFSRLQTKPITLVAVIFYSYWKIRARVCIKDDIYLRKTST